MQNGAVWKAQMLKGHMVFLHVVTTTVQTDWNREELKSVVNSCWQLSQRSD